ncbi:hypothetical protein TI39_contig4404g00001, partial [Zymoseptoria brevis]
MSKSGAGRGLGGEADDVDSATTRSQISSVEVQFDFHITSEVSPMHTVLGFEVVVVAER